MNWSEIPQDKKAFRDGGQAPKKVLYVTREDGTYTQANSVGWEAENIALQQAWEEIDEQLKEAMEDVQTGRKSPLAYYMVLQRMDIGILAAYVSKWQWQVKRHLKPAVFNKLPENILQRYASVFGISVADLKKPF